MANNIKEVFNLNRNNTNLSIYIPTPTGQVHIHIGNNTADGTVEEHIYDSTSNEITGYYICDDSKEYGSSKILHLKLMAEIARCYHGIAPSVNWTYEHVQSALMPIKMAFQDTDFSEIALEVFNGLFNR